MLAGPDLLVILVIALVIFGGNRIADLGAGLGKGIRSFKKGLEGEEIPQKRVEDNSGKSKE
jgi:sec-independent protein translocase protein TatA